MHRFPLALLCLLALAVPAATQASTTQTVSFEAPGDLLDPAKTEATLNTIAGLGTHALRVILYWHNVSPSPNSSTKPAGLNEADSAVYDWSKYDAIVNGAKARGWKVLLTVSGPAPKWGTLGRRDTVTHPDPNQFAQFVQAVAQHYGTKIDLWSIWNEPNHPDFLRPQFFRGQPASGEWYRKLFLGALRGFKAAKLPHAKVLMGETAPVGTSHELSPLVFLRQALCLNASYHKKAGCKELPIHGYAHHAYTRKPGPYWHPGNPNDVSIGTLSRLTRALDRAARAHAIPRHVPIYLTEFGIQSTPDPVYGVSQLRQAEYRAISEWIAWKNPRVRWFSQYLLDDDPHKTSGPKIARYPGFESGLRFANGRPKLSFKAFPLPLAALRSGHTVTLWGQARLAPRRTTVLILANGKTYKRLRTNSHGYFQRRVPYVHGRKYSLVWGGKRAPAMRVYARP